MVACIQHVDFVGCMTGRVLRGHRFKLVFIEYLKMPTLSDGNMDRSAAVNLMQGTSTSKAGSI